MCKPSETTVYKGIEFQGNVGCLTISNEKILFQQDGDASVKPRSWEWRTMKKYQVVFSSDHPTDKRLIKISNHQHKAVSFLVPLVDLLAIQDDMDARLANCVVKVESNERLQTPSDPKVSPEKVKAIVSKVQAIKAARQSQRRKTEVTPSLPQDSPVKKATIRRYQSFDAKKQPLGTTTTANDAMAKNATPEPNTEEKRLGGSFSQIQTIPRTSAVTTTKGLPKRSNSTGSRGGVSAEAIEDPIPRNSTSGSSKSNHPTKGKSALELAQTIVIKPAKETAQKIKPAAQKIIQPAKETAQKKIIQPTKNAARVALQPTKVIAEDMGLIKREDALEGGGSSHTSKKPFLHFLKAPPRRNFDDELDTADLYVPPGGEPSNPVASTYA